MIQLIRLDNRKADTVPTPMKKLQEIAYQSVAKSAHNMAAQAAQMGETLPEGFLEAVDAGELGRARTIGRQYADSELFAVGPMLMQIWLALLESATGIARTLLYFSWRR